MKYHISRDGILLIVSKTKKFFFKDNLNIIPLEVLQKAVFTKAGRRALSCKLNIQQWKGWLLHFSKEHSECSQYCPREIRIRIVRRYSIEVWREKNLQISMNTLLIYQRILPKNMELFKNYLKDILQIFCSYFLDCCCLTRMIFCGWYWVFLWKPEEISHSNWWSFLLWMLNNEN